MKNLISMTDFFFYIDNNREFARNYDRILAYAKFLKQPLELWMFVPCDENGDVLEEPICQEYALANQKYQQAKERVLFDGWNVNFETGIKTCISNESEYMLFLPSIMTIENILYTKPTLTPIALKQIGLCNSN